MCCLFIVNTHHPQIFAENYECTLAIGRHHRLNIVCVEKLNRSRRWSRYCVFRCDDSSAKKATQATARALAQGLWPAAIQPDVALVCRLMVSTPVIHGLRYYSFTDPEGMEGWVGLVGWPIADTLPTKWSHVNYGSDEDQIRESLPAQRPTS